MSFTARASEPRWPVEDGRTRTTIAGYVVDWTGEVPPTEAEVLAAMQPSAAQIKASMKEYAKSFFDHTNVVPLPDASLEALTALALLVMDQLNALRAHVIGVINVAWDPASLANGAELLSPAVNAPGVQFGDTILVEAPYSLQGFQAWAYVDTVPVAPAVPTVRVRLRNGTGGTINLGPGTWKLTALRFTNVPELKKDQIYPAWKAKIDSADVG